MAQIPVELQFAEATQREGHTGVALLQLLEMRLDAVVLRAGFVRYASRTPLVQRLEFSLDDDDANAPAGRPARGKA